MRSEPGPAGVVAFDAIAPAYDAWYATPLGRLVDRIEKQTVLTLVSERTEGAALDLSCGTGNYAMALAERGFRIVGVDVSASMLRAARAKSVQAKLDVAAILDRFGLWTLWRRLKRRFVPSVWRGARFFGVDELGDLLRARGFAPQRWRRAVHFLPLLARGGTGWLERWETIGARWMPASAAFVAVAARRA
jgi:SAM-dependent methyltransferase